MGVHPIAWGVIIWLLTMLIMFTILALRTHDRYELRFYLRCTAGSLTILIILIPIFLLEGFIPWPF
ncbi:hypothetical protein BISA_1368 [Bifidobacterium saguini DSM 23967]|uniref:Uncharacterized protein n=1 Tax=Bifidobacterium saguini DSM 23967 TaxID=1437607 RepID=A0A087DCF2_9BIFI|nr:hypothetical protein [Bifidobacterium saguini]KFI93202.1 hypothetical protein BISA_1368 [Bifidobacterium saguini DSM 23967]